MSLAVNSALVKEGAYHPSSVLFTKDSMDEYKPVTVVNILPVNSVSIHINQGRTGNMQVAWEP